MIRVLARMTEALRREGVAVSQAELLDAARAADLVGIEDRVSFKSALRSTLAKGIRQRQVFDVVFDRFFRSPPTGRRRKDRKDHGDGSGGARVSRATGGTPRERLSRTRTGRQDDRVRMLLDTCRLGRPREARLRHLKTGRSRTRAGALDQAREPLRRDLTAPMTTEQERILAKEIPRLIEAIRLRVGRRLRRAKRGRMWARQVFRENLSRGGIPFVIPFRRSKPRPTKVVLLVDVSYSVARAAGYFLWLAAEFLRLGRRCRVVAFVDRPVDASNAVRKWARHGPDKHGVLDRRGISPRGSRPGAGIRPGRTTFADLLDSLKDLNLQAPSDYGRALHALLGSHLRPRGRDAVLVVLGDGRTNRFEPLPWTLQEIASRCRTVLWLVPEPIGRWGTGDSALGAYLDHVDVVVEAHDLAGLARGLSELLRKV